MIRTSSCNGALEQRVEIIPDSGTGELAGIAGSMTIRVEGGTHYYQLACDLG